MPNQPETKAPEATTLNTKTAITRFALAALLLALPGLVLAGSPMGQLLSTPAANEFGEETAPRLVRPLTDPILITTDAEPRLAALENGQKIYIAPYSILHLTRIGGEVIEASVRRGSISVRDAAGELRRAGKNSRVHLGPMPEVAGREEVAPQRRRSKR